MYYIICKVKVIPQVVILWNSCLKADTYLYTGYTVDWYICLKSKVFSPQDLHRLYSKVVVMLDHPSYAYNPDVTTNTYV